jgi:hypothetical protein
MEEFSKNRFISHLVKKELPLGIQKIEESNLLTVQCALYSVSRVFYLCIHEGEHKSAMRAGCGNNER